MNRLNEASHKQSIVEICKRLYDRAYIAGRDGNVSIRIGDRILITPTGVNKGFLTEDMIVETDLEGNPIGGGKPSGEIFLHKAVYKHHPNASAVVHAHPPRCVSLTLAGITLEEPIIPRIVAALGPVPTVPYATPQTDELAQVLIPYLEAGHIALLMDRHGSVTTGADVYEAFDRIDMLEHAATIVWHAKSLASDLVPQIRDEEVRRLRGG